ncbi:MAG TPA: hypothetical protein VKG84_09435 [Candidatus Acidoferrales bacterium]|nr:hypothetical protein [Candidatus Acidoferrales bacterium]
MINRRIIVATLTGLLAVAGAQGLRGQAAGPAAPAGRTQDDSVSRLEPSAFKDLPAEVREELERRKCLVPQTYEARQPENVISGKFRDGDDRDWAVLCSREGTSSVLVFWNGSVKVVAEFSNLKDANEMQKTSRGIYGFSRRISVAPPREIHKRKQNRQLGPYEHDGINDGFVGKGSVIHYFRQGQWEDLEGAD